MARVVAVRPDDTAMVLTAAAAAAIDAARIRAEGLRFYRVVWDGTTHGDPIQGRYLSAGLIDEPTRLAKEHTRVQTPIVERLSADDRQHVVRDVLATGYDQTALKWGWSKFTVLMIMRKQGIKKRDQKRPS